MFPFAPPNMVYSRNSSHNTRGIQDTVSRVVAVLGSWVYGFAKAPQNLTRETDANSFVVSIGDLD